MEFARSARDRGEKVIAFALEGVASPELDDVADRVYWLKMGQYKKFVLIQLKERIRKAALLGKVQKQAVYSASKYDDPAREALGKVKDNKDYSLMSEVTRHLAKIGIEVIDPRGYLGHIIPKKGLLTKEPLSEELKGDIKFGSQAAKVLAGADIGQAVVVKKKAIVSVEAMEGTDAVIERSRRVAGDGCVLIKLSRPEQDMRWDIPVIGRRTIKGLIANKFSGVVIESEKMFFLDMETLIPEAEEHGLFIQAV